MSWPSFTSVALVVDDGIELEPSGIRLPRDLGFRICRCGARGRRSSDRVSIYSSYPRNVGGVPDQTSSSRNRPRLWMIRRMSALCRPVAGSHAVETAGAVADAVAMSAPASGTAAATVVRGLSAVMDQVVELRLRPLRCRPQFGVRRFRSARAATPAIPTAIPAASTGTVLNHVGSGLVDRWCIDRLRQFTLRHPSLCRWR